MARREGRGPGAGGPRKWLRTPFAFLCLASANPRPRSLLTRRPDGLKKAYVRLTTDYDALDVANKIGII